MFKKKDQEKSDANRKKGDFLSLLTLWNIDGVFVNTAKGWCTKRQI